MKITGKFLNFLMACCDVADNGITAKCLGALMLLWDADKILLSRADINECEAVRTEAQSDIKVMFSKRGIPVKP